MSPRNEFELGRERKLLVNMKIHDRAFNGLKAGKYTVFLTYGSLADFSKPIFTGKIEYIYSTILGESLLARKLVRPLEKKKFLSFLFQRLPELTIKSYLITGELVAPDAILDFWKEDTDRDTAWADMKSRNLVSPQTLWVKPYPPEKKLKEIMSGTVMLPDILQENVKDIEGLTGTYRNTVVEINRSTSDLLKEVIPLARLIVSSISDATFVMGLIISDRAQQIRGLGLAQLAERGGMEAILEAARELIRKRDEFLKIMSAPPSKEEIAKVQNLEKMIIEIQEHLKRIEKAKPLAPAPIVGAK